MKTTTYICDKCKTSVSKDDLVEINIEVKNLYFAEQPTWNRNKITVEVCKDCLSKKGFVMQKQEEKPIEDSREQNNKLLRDKLIDILYELDVAFVE